MVQAGRRPSEQFGFVNTPIYRGSTVLFATAAELRNYNARFRYGTKGTPTTEALETAWSELSGAAGTVLVPSGLAAVTLALLASLGSGDHVLVPDSVYGPTRVLCNRTLKRLGVETTYYDPLVGAGIEALMRPDTRAILTESPGSQTMEVQDVPAIAEVAHRHGALVLMDNTWATPLLFPAHEHGVDLVIEAGTKYLGGHSDLLLGLVSANAAAWPRLRETFDEMAICAGPEDVFLGLRGIRTMELRLREHERQALGLAEWLAGRPEVQRVLHPAFPSCPGHEIWKRDFKGSSGLFSVILQPAPRKAVDAMLDGLELFGMGYSWGGFESLALPSDPAHSRSAVPWQASGPLIRFHAGLEDPRDLIADLEAGFVRRAAAAAAPEPGAT